MAGRIEAREQLNLPGFEGLRQKVLEEKKPPQPSRELTRELDGLELLYRPLNLKFRGRVNRWLQTLKFPLIEVLGEDEKRLVKFYLWPQPEGRWLTQKETASQMGWSERKTKSVSFGIKLALLKLWRREEVGPEAIETLRLPWVWYRALVEKQIATKSQVLNLSDKDEIRQLCGSPYGLKVIQQSFEEQGVRWEPEVEFPDFHFER